MRKTAVITGASRGIGFAIAKALENQFENLILIAKHEETLKKAASEVKHARITTFAHDLADQKQIEKLVANITANFDSIDVLVNVAGIYLGKRFEKTTMDELNKLIQVNFNAYFALSHQLLPLLKKGTNSQIINISSCAASAQMYGESLYSATKAAVTAFSNVIRKELNADNIRVTAIQPWGVDTYDVPQPDTLLNPNEVGKLVAFITAAQATTQFDLIEISHIKQWRGDKPDWIA